MLDSLKSRAGGRKAVQQQSDELIALIASAREERSALSAMLDAMAAKSARLSPVSRQLDQVAAKAAGIVSQLDDIGRRVVSLDERTAAVEAMDERIRSLSDAARQAEQATQQALGPDGELQRHRQTVQELVAKADETTTALAALKAERDTIEEIRQDLRQAEDESRETSAKTGALKTQMDQIRELAASLQKEHDRIQISVGQARDDGAATLATLAEIENKMGPLTTIRELSRTTDEQLRGLNSLAEQVTAKTRALESQQQSVEHAVVQANRVSEMVWSMDVQIAKLNEGLSQTTKAEETLARVEKIAQESAAQLQTATENRMEAEREATALTTKLGTFIDSLREQLGSVTVQQKELKVFDERVQLLTNALAETESRVQTVAVQHVNTESLVLRAETLAGDFESLSARALVLDEKQAALDGLNDRFRQVEALATATAQQTDNLLNARRDLDGFRKELQDLHVSHGEVTRLRGTLDVERERLEALGTKMQKLSTLAPELDSKLGRLAGQATLVDDTSRKVERLEQTLTGLDAHISKVAERASAVEVLDRRLDGLHTLTADVGAKLADQLARRAEFETLAGTIELVSSQTADAQHRLDGLKESQDRLANLTGDLQSLEAAVANANQRVQQLLGDEGSISRQEARLSELVTANQDIAVKTAGRVEQMQKLADELASLSTMKDKLTGELDRLQSRHRESVDQIRASEEQLSRAEQLFADVERRRVEAAASEQQLASFEARLRGLVDVVRSVEEGVESIATRQALVDAVKAEVEAVHEIGTRNKADLVHLIDHRAEISSLRKQVDILLLRAVETERRMGEIDARKAMVDDVHGKANAVVELLDDVRGELEALGEHKAVIEHVAEKTAQLDFVLQEARKTVRTLQHERGLAERVEQGIKQLRSKRTVKEGKRQSA